jgi:hypothetical protein
LISNPFTSTPETPIKKIDNNENKGKELAIFSPFEAASYNLSTKAPRRLLRLQDPDSSMYWHPVLHLRAQSADAEMRKSWFSFGLTSVDTRKRLPHPILHWLSNMIMKPCPLGKGLSLVLRLRLGLLVVEVRHVDVERFWFCLALSNGLSLILRLRLGLLVVEVGHMNMECLWFGFTLSKGLSLILRRGLLVVEVGHMNVERFWVCLALREGLSLVLRRGLLVVEVGHVNVEWFWISLALTIGVQDLLPILDDTRNIIGDTSTLASMVGNCIEVYAMLWLRVTLSEALSFLTSWLLVVEMGHVDAEWFWISLALTIGVKNLLSILNDAGDIVSNAGTLTNTMSDVVNIHTVFWLRIASEFVFFVENWEVVDGMETLRLRSATPDRIASDFMIFVENWEVVDGMETLRLRSATPDRIASNFAIVNDWTMTLREPVDFLSQLQIRTGGRMSFAGDFVVEGFS